jgi:DNA polymerase III delta' subunit
MNASRRQIIGHDLQRQSLKELLSSSKLPQTMMFVGPSGVGKLLVAHELCRTLFCELNSPGKIGHYGGCGQCHSCHLVDSGNNPDFHVIDCASDDWNTGSIRELMYSLHMRAFSGEFKIVIMNHAEQLSMQAANALLKQLEEPRPGTYFILVSSNSSRLPMTIRSRCQSWYFDRLSDDEVAAILKAHPDPEVEEMIRHVSAAEVAILADGSLENIDNLKRHLTTWPDLTEALRGGINGDSGKLIEFIREISQDRESLRDHLDLIRIFARHMLHKAADCDKQRRWAFCLSNIIVAERLIFERNLAAAAVLTAVLVDLLPSSGGDGTLWTSDLIEKYTV